MGLTFFIAASIVLCFEFVPKTVDNTLELWLLLNLVKAFSASHPAPPQQVGCGWARGWEGTETGQLARMDIPYHIKSCSANKNWDKWRSVGGLLYSDVVDACRLAGGEWLLLHHMDFFLLSFMYYTLFNLNSWIFSFLFFLFPSLWGAGNERAAVWVLMLDVWSTHNNIRYNTFVIRKILASTYFLNAVYKQLLTVRNFKNMS